MKLEHLWLPYSQMQTVDTPLQAVRTYGSRIELADSRVLIDGIASWWTACHGYNHPHICGQIATQLEKMPHVMLGGLVHEPALELSRRLAATLPGDLSHCFFSESGSVTVEVAIKMALQYWLNKGVTQRRRFLAFEGGYHGDTFAAMSVCDPEEGMHRRFTGSLLEQSIVALPRDDQELAAFEKSVAERAHGLAGMIIEPLVQSAGGFIMHSAEALAAVVAIARRYELIVIFDEIATGFGRTGSLFAYEQAGVEPDIATFSKALTGGTLPLAVTVANQKVYDAFLSDDPELALMHGPTFCGNPLGCAAANASLDLFESEPRLAQCGQISEQLEAELGTCASLPGVREVRVKGAIGVVELEQPPKHAELRRRFVDAGVWIRPFGKVVYLMPALTIEPDELSVLTRAIAEVLGSALR
jgi:adenosylmethionine-8-amino-7-oxononanoate aminotransferase